MQLLPTWRKGGIFLKALSPVAGANITSARSAPFSITANPSAATSATPKPTASLTPPKVGGIGLERSDHQAPPLHPCLSFFIFPELIAKMEKRKDATDQPPDETSE